MAPGIGFLEDNFSMDWGGRDGSGSNASDGEQWGTADEALLARPPLTCCAARFLTGRGTMARGLGTPGVRVCGGVGMMRAKRGRPDPRAMGMFMNLTF